MGPEGWIFNGVLEGLGDLAVPMAPAREIRWPDSTQRAIER